MEKGKVYLVGAGPGDEGLITVKGFSLIGKADAILYDRLSNKSFLEYRKKESEIIYVGKTPGVKGKKQEDIEKIMVEKALEGKIVVRLKGGDPFVFGRGGEEGLELSKKGIPFEIVPGITSAISAPAYAGIPITHRNISSSFHVITGNEDPDKGKTFLDYSTLAKLSGTLVFMMGMANLDKISKKLMYYGKDKKTPVAIIEKGTTSNQVTVSGNLENISKIVEEEGIKPPAVIIIGNVVNLKESLSWKNKTKLNSKRILITRQREKAIEMKKELQDLGAEAVIYPTIEIKEPNNWKVFDNCLDRISEYDYIIFTSQNGVKAFFERLIKKGVDIRKLSQSRIVSIGSVTAASLKEKGIIPQYIPENYTQEGIVSELRPEIKKGEKVLIPTSNLAREFLAEELKKEELEVDKVNVYETAMPYNEREELIELLKNGIDIITFTSPSTVENFISILGKGNINMLDKTQIASIGPVTSKKTKELGLVVDFEAKEYTVKGLIECILEVSNNND